MSEAAQSKTLKIKASPTLKRRVERLAKERAVKPAHIMREAIVEYVEKAEAAAA